MRDSFYEISKDKYSDDLLNELVNLSRNDAENEVLINLISLINCDLNDLAIRNLLQTENFILSEDIYENNEISARINDVKFIVKSSDKLKCIRQAVESYYSIYKKTGKLKYFIRALELIRKVKSSFESVLRQFEEEILQIFTKETAYNKLKLVENSVFLLSESSLKILIDHCNIHLEKSFEILSFNDAKKYIIALNKLGHFDNSEFKIQTALALEKEADYFISQMKPNTYYPNILTIYTKALQELNGIAIEEEFKIRLQRKIKTEQRLFAQMLSKMSISSKSDLNICELLEQENVVDFNSGFKYLLGLPIMETQMLNKISVEISKESFLNQFFGSYVNITNKGTVSGISNEEVFISNLLREQFRAVTISFIKEIKLTMDLDHKVSKDLVAEMVAKCDSSFIPTDRADFYIEGLYQGFQNNFVVSSHILIPQIENSLKHILEKNDRNTTKLTEDIQNDNTLGSILSVEKNKMLDGICNQDLLFELNSFLVDGNSANFRNRVSHGLISSVETDYYGIYLWWLVLKMIKQTNKYFKNRTIR